MPSDRLFLRSDCFGRRCSANECARGSASIEVIRHPERNSLTSPSADTAAAQKTEIPGGFTIKGNNEMGKGRASNFEDLLQGTPGLFLQSENEVEVSKISMRGSGIDSADEPLGVEFLLDGMSFQQGDGEVILEDFDVNTIKYAEVYRGANAFQYGALTLGGAINLVPYTGYDADPFHTGLRRGATAFCMARRVRAAWMARLTIIHP